MPRQLNVKVGSRAVNQAYTRSVSDSVGVQDSRTVNNVSETVQPAFAGHTPYKVMVGMAAPEVASAPPTYDDTTTVGGTVWDSAFTMVTKPRPEWDNYGTLVLAERRIFDNANISLSSLRTMMNLCDGNNQFGLISFKHSNFSTIYTGGLNSTLNIIRDEMILRRTSGAGGTRKPPHAIGIYHEPAGDAGIVLSEWAKMQIYCSNYFAGWGTNPTTMAKTTYTAANDVRDQMTWMSIMNGNKWGPNAVDTTAINDAHPQILIDTYRENGSLLMADFYDGVPNTDNLNDYKASSDRTSEKIQAYISWHRSRNSGMLGAGEYSTTQYAEMDAVWAVVRANRDIFCILNYFNSGQNSKWEWRLIPANYPQTNGWALGQYLPGNYVEIGGNNGGFTQAPGHSTQEQLKKFRKTVYESNLPAYTSPL